MRIDPNRRTGRTKAHLEAAVVAAKGGDRVLFVVHDRAMAQYALDLLLSVSMPSAVNRTAMQAEYGKGSVTVAPVRSQRDFEMKTHGFARVMIDHAWREHRLI